MTQQEEINILQSLKGDTYFAQKFGADIDQMCQNISNDFPIELGCQFMQKEEALKKELEDVKKKANEKFLAFAQEVICDISNYDDGDNEVYKTVEGYIGKKEIIKYKHSQHIDLNEDEINYLVSKLK